MTVRAALCIDEETCLDPSLVGLAGERLDSLEWLDVYPSGAEARAAIAENPDVERVWVVSCDDVEPINLAASLKGDRPELLVSLVHPEAGGSVLSRAHNASIDEVVELSSFVRSYGELKGRNAVFAEPAASTAAVEVRVQDAQRDLVVPQDVTHQQLAAPKLERALHAPAVLQASTFVMPVVSGSGGAGKSAVSVVGAHVAQRMGYRTLLLDYDLQFGDAAFLSGIKDPIAIDEAFAHPELVDREIERNDGPVVLAAPARLESAELVVRALPDHFDALVSKFDFVIANTGAAWAEQHAALLERSNAALFLIDQRISSIRACKHALGLCSRCGIATGQFQFAVNRCAKGAPLTSIDVSCAMRGLPVFELRDGGPDVEELLGSGSPGTLLDTRNEFGSSVEQLLARVLPDGGTRKVAPRVGQEGPGEKLWGRSDGKRGRHAGRKWGKGRS